MNKKISISLILIAIAMLLLWVWTLFIKNSSIIIGGSTSVNPFMQELTKNYYEHNGSKTDFVYNSTGSQAGVSGVEKNMYTAGFISKEVKEETLSENNSFSKKINYQDVLNENDLKDSLKADKVSGEFENNSFASLEFALDAIAIIYNAPEWYRTFEFKSNVGDNKITLETLMNFNLKKDDNNILKQIYLGKLTWLDLAKHLLKEKNYNINLPNFEDQKINTITRESGSGTRSAFTDLTGIKSSDMKSSEVNSNGSMFRNIRDNIGIGYVSYAFVSSVYEEVDASGKVSKNNVRIAGIGGKKLGNKADSGSEPENWYGLIQKNDGSWVPTKEKNEEFIRKCYEFKRPFVSIFNLKNKNFKYLLELFVYMISDESNESFEKEGLVKNFVINPQAKNKVKRGFENG